MNKPIYEIICENIKDGVLNEDCALPSEDEDSSLWAPGALDGVYVYHMRHPALEEEDLNKLIEVLNTASDGDFEKADNLLFELTKHIRAICFVDDVQQYIIEHKEELNLENLFDFAMAMITGSSHTECVKTGLEVLELFDSSHDSIKEIVRNIGLFDEFTIFAAWCMRQWDNGNDEIFNLAKKVYGWGKVHVVEILEPKNEEIRKWFLAKGIHNGVMAGYSALTCWNKSEAEKVLMSKPSEKEYRELTDLIDGLMDEGPAVGVSALENAEEILNRFLAISSEYSLSVKEYTVILNIKQWAEEAEEGNMPSVAETAARILNSDTCRKTVAESLDNGNVLRLAEELGIV